MESGNVQFGVTELAAILSEACAELYDYYDFQADLGGYDVPRFDMRARVSGRSEVGVSTVSAPAARSGGAMQPGAAVSEVSALSRSRSEIAAPGAGTERTRSGVHSGSGAVSGGGAGKLLAGVRRLSGGKGLERYSGLSFGEREDRLAKLRESAGVCKRCSQGLRAAEGAAGRIAGEGRLDAPLFFVCPGNDPAELREGRIFAGAVGELMDNILKAIGWSRTDIYFANRICCVPEGALSADADREAAYSCSGYLLEQIGLVRPRVIMCWGQAAFQSLFRRDRRNIQEYAGRWLDFEGIPVMATFHPGYLLRNPRAKRNVWRAVQDVAARLQGPGGGSGSFKGQG